MSIQARGDTRAVTAACLNAGGLWQIYSTPLVGWMQSGSLVHVAVHAHLLLAGYLLTTAAIGLDSTPHRAPHLTTAVAPLATMASHSILAKTLFATPPDLYAVGDVQPARSSRTTRAADRGRDRGALLRALVPRSRTSCVPPAARRRGGKPSALSSPAEGAVTGAAGRRGPDRRSSRFKETASYRRMPRHRSPIRGGASWTWCRSREC
ncbi:cytochrome c oxidase assembly protein [Microbacterium oleivorans]|uniref:cytochrome c oxidase assembly protein n=1 Tax=Microbacterium oleivorans TaxID=273677 RepID=UPI00344F4B88